MEYAGSLPTTRTWSFSSYARALTHDYTLPTNGRVLSISARAGVAGGAYPYTLYANIYTSMDGKNWTNRGKISNDPTTSTKVYVYANARYIRIKGEPAPYASLYFSSGSVDYVPISPLPSGGDEAPDALFEDNPALAAAVAIGLVFGTLFLANHFARRRK